MNWGFNLYPSRPFFSLFPVESEAIRISGVGGEGFFSNYAREKNPPN